MLTLALTTLNPNKARFRAKFRGTITFTADERSKISAGTNCVMVSSRTNCVMISPCGTASVYAIPPQMLAAEIHHLHLSRVIPQDTVWARAWDRLSGLHLLATR